VTTPEDNQHDSTLAPVAERIRLRRRKTEADPAAETDNESTSSPGEPAEDPDEVVESFETLTGGLDKAPADPPAHTSSAADAATLPTEADDLPGADVVDLPAGDLSVGAGADVVPTGTAAVDLPESITRVGPPRYRPQEHRYPKSRHQRSIP